MTGQKAEIARSYAHGGEKDRALEWPEKAYEARDTQTVFRVVGPRRDGLCSQPRFQDLLQRMNFPVKR
jgi:hypothetical protein